MLPSGTISSARTQVNRPAPSVCEWARWCGSTVSPDELDVTINIDSRELKTLGNCKPRGACAIAREHHIFKEKIMSTPPFAPPAGSEVATPATSNRVPRCFALRTAVCASDGFELSYASHHTPARFLCLLVSAPVAVVPFQQPAAQEQAQNKTETVYVTRTGKRYHRDGCRYLARSRIPCRGRMPRPKATLPVRSATRHGERLIKVVSAQRAGQHRNVLIYHD